ncbi:PRC-barrel domain-containing protein [Belliella sp. DSM 111904]|uniref:PRC-barrel domain-containing protein n=1 Tax=Belliella filtrata TaxID=2923435 RepID=A0ABS9V2J1_9BACT|nr:PRC-barrel domain-containing protein [Belliella filtrata]MCH7410593.1 PRC-barrel domain-containing protein [Belliella filtrata]
MENSTNHQILNLNEIKNATVENYSGETIGTIDDVMIDGHDGHIAYVALQVNTGFLNMGSKYFAIPWRAFSFKNLEDRLLLLDVDKQKLEDSPGFDKDNWPTGPQYEFISEVHSYYGFSRDDDHIDRGRI